MGLQKTLGTATDMVLTMVKQTKDADGRRTFITQATIYAKSYDSSTCSEETPTLQ